MDDKVFNLIEKMYSDLTGRLEQIDSNLKEFKKETKSELTKISTIIENDIKPNIKLALEGYHDTNEKLTRLEEKIDNISEKVDTHDIQIQVIKGGKEHKKTPTYIDISKTLYEGFFATQAEFGG